MEGKAKAFCLKLLRIWKRRGMGIAVILGHLMHSNGGPFTTSFYLNGPKSRARKQLNNKLQIHFFTELPVWTNSLSLSPTSLGWLSRKCRNKEIAEKIQFCNLCPRLCFLFVHHALDEKQYVQYLWWWWSVFIKLMMFSI